MAEGEKEIVAQWRRWAKGNKFEDYLELSHGIYDPPPGTGTYAFFPSWPHKPFLSIPQNKRKFWYEAIGLPALLRELVDKPIEGVRLSITRLVPSRAFRRDLRG